MSSKLVRKQLREMLATGTQKAPKRAKPAFPEMKSEKGKETQEQKIARRVDAYLGVKKFSESKKLKKGGPTNAEKVLMSRQGKS